MAKQRRRHEAKSATERTLAVVSGKWTLSIIEVLAGARRRFGEIERSLHGITARTLASRLALLEESGIVTRESFAEVPPRVEYALTERGSELLRALSALEAWGEREQRKGD